MTLLCCASQVPTVAPKMAFAELSSELVAQVLRFADEPLHLAAGSVALWRFTDVGNILHAWRTMGQSHGVVIADNVTIHECACFFMAKAHGAGLGFKVGWKGNVGGITLAADCYNWLPLDRQKSLRQFEAALPAPIATLPCNEVLMVAKWLGKHPALHRTALLTPLENGGCLRAVQCMLHQGGVVDYKVTLNPGFIAPMLEIVDLWEVKERKQKEHRRLVAARERAKRDAGEARKATLRSRER